MYPNSVFRESRLKEAILVVAIVSFASAQLAHQDWGNSSKHPTVQSVSCSRAKLGNGKR